MSSVVSLMRSAPAARMALALAGVLAGVTAADDAGAQTPKVTTTAPAPAGAGEGALDWRKGDRADKYGGRRDRGESGDNEKLRQQLVDQFRAMRMWTLTEELKLDEPTAAKVFPLLSRYDDLERELGKARGETMRALRAALDLPAPETAQVEALVDKLVALKARRHALEAEKMASLRKVLSSVQMGKMLMLAPRIDADFRRRIHEALGKPDLAGPRKADDHKQPLGPPDRNAHAPAVRPKR